MQHFTVVLDLQEVVGQCGALLLQALTAPQGGRCIQGQCELGRSRRRGGLPIPGKAVDDKDLDQLIKGRQDLVWYIPPERAGNHSEKASSNCETHWDYVGV